MHFPLTAWLFTISHMITVVSPYRILLMPKPSEQNVHRFKLISSVLAERGHNVHILLPTTYPDIAELKESEHLVDIMEYAVNDTSKEDHFQFEPQFGNNPIAAYKDKSEVFRKHCHDVLSSTEIDAKIRAVRFDLALVDASVYSRCYYIVPYRLYIPYVSVTNEYEPWLLRSTSLPSFVPFPLMTPPLTHEMTFWQRVLNLWTIVDWIARSSHLEYLADSLVLEYAPNKAAVALNYLASQSLLWLVDIDINMDYPRPIMPNEVNIAGLSARLAETLTDDMQTFCNNAAEGVILLYFDHQSPQQDQYYLIMIDALKRLSRSTHIIIHYHHPVGVNLPRNFKLLKTISRNDVLGHNNTRLFITDAGSFGQLEGLYHAVPMLNIPFLPEQHYNAKRSDYHGFSETVTYRSITWKVMLGLVQKLMKDTSHRRKIKKASSIFRSAINTPHERLAHSIEQILRYGGGYLHSTATDLPWYQYLLLDVLAFLTLVFTAFAWIIFNTLMLCLRRCRYVWTELSEEALIHKQRKQVHHHHHPHRFNHNNNFSKSKRA